MFSDPFLVIIILVCFGVLAVLMVGIGGFAKGGAFNKRYANKLMRLRIAVQFVAVVLVLIYVAWRGMGG